MNTIGQGIHGGLGISGGGFVENKGYYIFILSINNYMEKLLQTNELLNEITEAVQEFQIRRCFIVKKLIA